MENHRKVIFVYNADSGLFSSLTDFAHKIISPSTYACNLCRVTYGNFVMKKEWKQYMDSLSLAKEFLHRDEFRQKYPQNNQNDFPAVFILEENEIKTLLSAEDINAVSGMDELKGLLSRKLEA